MSDFLLRSHELMQSIDVLTDTIFQKVKQNELDHVNPLTTERLQLLTELVSLSATDNDKSILSSYLIDLQKRDQLTLQLVAKEHETVKNTLLNLKNIKQYVNV